MRSCYFISLRSAQYSQCGLVAVLVPKGEVVDTFGGVEDELFEIVDVVGEDVESFEMIFSFVVGLEEVEFAGLHGVLPFHIEQHFVEDELAPVVRGTVLGLPWISLRVFGAPVL